MNRSEVLDALMPVIERLTAEGYVFPLGGGLVVRDDGGVLVSVREADPYLESVLHAGCPNVRFDFKVTVSARHVVLPPG